MSMLPAKTCHEYEDSVHLYNLSGCLVSWLSLNNRQECLCVGEDLTSQIKSGKSKKMNSI